MGESKCFREGFNGSPATMSAVDFEHGLAGEKGM